VHGSRDPFGSLEEMRTAIQLIPAPVKLIEVEGAGHDLGRDHAELAQRIVDQWSLMRR
jgi:predicted alpha/beta-hydrolase family hydrolase